MIGMKPLTAVLPYAFGPLSDQTLDLLSESPLVDSILILHRIPIQIKRPKVKSFVTRNLGSGETLLRVINSIQTRYLLYISEPRILSFQSQALEKFIEKAEKKGSGIVYSDFYEQEEERTIYHPLNDYQWGSVRDDFDFGPMILLSTRAIEKVLKKYGLLLETEWGALYDLRLKISIDHRIDHLRQPLYTVNQKKELSQEERRFSYLDPENRRVQRELETIFTDYLKKIGAYIPPGFLKSAKPMKFPFHVEASVILPVRNRKETIGEAMRSALCQKTDFPFNIIVVDNHSTDGTTTIVSDLAAKESRIVHLIPKRRNLGIGGCWNEALHHPLCGRYAIQLDSDDLYSTPYTLQTIVDKFRDGKFAMVIGSYTLVDSNLKEIPPGLIDHREWTDENGHNNALRVNGFGAPRAFDTSILRGIGFPNLNYGEDYAVGLRICREFRIGRIYESLYLCRRWSGNSDANLSLEEANQKDTLKDRIRTEEILSRQKINQSDSEGVK
jgi:hypothetical protein